MSEDKKFEWVSGDRFENADNIMYRHEAMTLVGEKSAQVLSESLAGFFVPLQKKTMDVDDAIVKLHELLKKYNYSQEDAQNIPKLLTSIMKTTHEIRGKMNIEIAALEYEALQPEDLQ